MINGFVENELRLSRVGRAVVVGVLAVVVLSAVPGALGQAPVNPTANVTAGAPVQTGRLLDRNPQLGSDGYNYARPVSPLLSGNVIASGLASDGLSLRSFSPISDPTAFRASLGSAALSAFRRDSVSVASPALGSAVYGQPFYDPTTTVPTAALLQSLAGFRASDSGSPAALDLRVQTRLTPPTGLAAQIAGLSPPASPATPQAPPPAVTGPSSLATSSSIFGAQPPPRLVLPAEPELPWRRATAGDTTGRGLARREGSAGGTSPEAGLPGVSELLATPLGGLPRSDSYPRFGVVSPSTLAPQGADQPGLVVPPESGAGSVLPTTPQVVSAQLLPGFDVFTDMQLALALLSNPNATWFDELRRAARERPDLARQVGEQAAYDASQFVDRMLNTPLRSLTGAGSSTLNDQMLKAESSMSIAHYAEAVDRYDTAHMIDPANPLPLIGKGHALLAQGNYNSAALTLLQGIELADRYPGMAPLLLKRLDLKSLMGGGEVIDIRRADIMRQLAQHESPELRFLLGYLEYHSGDREHGLENLKRAAANPRAGMMIARYPALLSGEAAGTRSEPAQPEERPPGGTPAPVVPHMAVSSQPAGELVVPPRSE